MNIFFIKQWLALKNGKFAVKKQAVFIV